MPDFLYPSFMTNEQECKQAEALWHKRWEGLISRLSPADRWESPWLNTASADGVSWCDGNPIFSAVCPERHLGIRVIQLEPLGDATDLRFWTDAFGKDSPEEIKELVISCVLSDQTLLRTLDLMKQWITRQEIRLDRVEHSRLSLREPQIRELVSA